MVDFAYRRCHSCSVTDYHIQSYTVTLLPANQP